jgi:hypothetical protein
MVWNDTRVHPYGDVLPQSCTLASLLRAGSSASWPVAICPRAGVPRTAGALRSGRRSRRHTVSLIRGFPGWPEDQGLDVPAGGRAASSAALGSGGPAAADDVAVPAQDRVRGSRSPCRRAFDMTSPRPGGHPAVPTAAHQARQRPHTRSQPVTGFAARDMDHRQITRQ